jgi:hypothetical protein
MALCDRFRYLFCSRGVVTIDVMVMMATDTRGPDWVDREAQLALDVEEEG